MEKGDTMKGKTILLGSVIVLVIVLAIALGSVGGIAAAPYLQRQSGASTNPTQQQSATALAPTAVPLPANASASELTASNVYRKVSPSVVSIQVVENSSAAPSTRRQSPGSPNQPPSGAQVALGSGFVLDTQGHIVTNDHVVAGASQVEVTFLDGTTVHAKVVGQDASSDLAVIQVNVNPSLLQPVTLGDSASLVVGQQVYAIGNPFGELWTMTSGIVSAVGRTVQSGTSNYSIPEVIQTDAAINPGNSGGPLLDSQGRVIGVNEQIESQSGSSSGVGFAIPVNIVKRVTPALIKDGQYNYAWLGVTGTDLTLDLNEAMNLPTNLRGVLVVDVASGGPADQAGLRGSQQQATIFGSPTPIGGDVITAVDNQPVTGMGDMIDYLFTSKQPGDKVTLTVLRNGQQQDITVTLGQRPATP
jgi:S1-C subfamily serine protease